MIRMSLAALVAASLAIGLPQAGHAAWPVFDATNYGQLGREDLDLALALGRRLDVDLPLGTIARANLAAGLGIVENPGDVHTEDKGEQA